MEFYVVRDKKPTKNVEENELMHYGILGMKWGVKNGPPYPLDSQKTIKECKKEYKDLLKRRYRYYDEYGMDIPEKEQKEFDSLDDQINKLIEGPYSLAVFNEYSKTQPMLINNRTGEKVTWKDAFGDSYDELTKSIKHTLVGLVEGGTGRYRFK